jgi:hypothetical protein
VLLVQEKHVRIRQQRAEEFCLAYLGGLRPHLQEAKQQRNLGSQFGLPRGVDFVPLHQWYPPKMIPDTKTVADARYYIFLPERHNEERCVHKYL